MVAKRHLVVTSAFVMSFLVGFSTFSAGLTKLGVGILLGTVEFSPTYFAQKKGSSRNTGWTFGSSSDFSIRYILKSLNLGERDVTIVQVGDNPTREAID